MNNGFSIKEIITLVKKNFFFVIIAFTISSISTYYVSDKIFNNRVLVRIDRLELPDTEKYLDLMCMSKVSRCPYINEHYLFSHQRARWSNKDYLINIINDNELLFNNHLKEYSKLNIKIEDDHMYIDFRTAKDSSYVKTDFRKLIKIIEKDIGTSIKTTYSNLLKSEQEVSMTIEEARKFLSANGDDIQIITRGKNFELVSEDNPKLLDKIEKINKLRDNKPDLMKSSLANMDGFKSAKVSYIKINDYSALRLLSSILSGLFLLILLSVITRKI